MSLGGKAEETLAKAHEVSCSHCWELSECWRSGRILHAAFMRRSSQIPPPPALEMF